jgi:hypothetical protein
MNQTVEVDAGLLEHAARLTGLEDRQKLVERALNELIRRRAKIESLLALAGKIQFYDGYDHKQLRATRYDTP